MEINTHAATNCALNALLYPRRRGRPSLENCSIVSTILQSWTSCPLLTALSIWGHRTDTALRHLSAPYFVATKLEAFNDRGNGDVLLSHDLEDIITVVDGRAELVAELAMGPEDLRTFIAGQFEALLKHPDFSNALPGIVSQSSRTGLVLQRFASVAALMV